MASSYTPLLGFVLPVTGELAGTWGTVWNNEGTSLLDSSIAGTTTLSTDADVTLTTTTGASNQARQAILLCSGARTALRNITAPAQSKIYVVINNTTGGFGVVIRGVGPTTGVTVAAGRTAVVVWNGADFVEVAPATATTATNLAGGAAGSLPYQTGAGVTTFRAIGTANQVLTSSGTAPQWSSSLSGLTSIVSTGNISGTSLTIHPTLSGKIGANTAWIGENSTATVAVGMYQAGSGFTNIANINFISSGSTIRSVIACTEESGGDAAYLAFSTRNASASVGERMRITASGNVGIGVTPNAWDATYQALQMESSGGPSLTGGNAELYLSTNAYYNAGWKYGASSQPALRYAQNNGQHQWFYSPSGTAGNAITFTQAMTLDASGNLGIGTTSPQAKLHVAGSGAQARFEVTTAADARHEYYRNSVREAYLSWDANILSLAATQASGVMTFVTGGTTERMRIDSSGNLGLGTTTPNTRLTVAASGSTPTEILRTTSTASAATYLALQAYNASSAAVTYASVGSVIEANTAGSHSGAFVINTVSAAAAAERMRVTASGNVLIGTATDVGSNRLQVSGNIWNVVADASTSYVGWGVNPANTRTLIGFNANTDFRIWNRTALPLVFLTNDVERMRVDSAGNVGIGTASPVNKLQVNGSFGRNAPVTKTASFTLADTENWLICNGTGTITVTLPAASSWTGREVMIKTIAAFTVVSASSNVVPLAGGAAGTAILAATAGAWATLVSDGTNWIIMQA